jgi:hypothetical protein
MTAVAQSDKNTASAGEEVADRGYGSTRHGIEET